MGALEEVVGIARQREKQTFAAAIRKLQRKHGTPHRPARRTIVEYMVRELAQEFSPQQTAVRILNRLSRDFADWNEVRVSSLDEVSESIGRYTYSRKLARVLKEVLQRCFDEFHDLELSFAEDSSMERTKSALLRLDVNPTIIGSAMLDWAEDGDLPITTDLSRVLQRLGFVENHASPAATKRKLEELVTPGSEYTAYRLLHDHGGGVCISRGFDCAPCVLKTLCPRGKKELAKTG